MTVVEGPLKGLRLGEGPLAPAGIPTPEAHDRASEGGDGAISTRYESTIYERVAWLEDERPFEERHAVLYVRAVLASLDESLCLAPPNGEYQAVQRLYRALAWAVPEAISMDGQGISVDAVGTSRWRAEFTAGIAQLRVTGQNAFTPGERTEDGLRELRWRINRIVLKVADEYLDGADRRTALVKIASPAFAFIAGGGEGLTPWTDEWTEPFGLRLTEAEAVAHQVLDTYLNPQD